MPDGFASQPLSQFPQPIKQGDSLSAMLKKLMVIADSLEKGSAMAGASASALDGAGVPPVGASPSATFSGMVANMSAVVDRLITAATDLERHHGRIAKAISG